MASLIRFSSVACPGTIKNRRTCIQLQSNSILQVQKHGPGQLWRLDGMRMGSKRREQWRASCQDGSGSIPPSNSSPSLHEFIENFYRVISEKDNERELDDILSDDCRFEELVYYLPFDTKEKVRHFLHDLRDAMGPNVQIVTESITEVENNTAIAVWHLEWKGKHIPFTTGCSFIEYKEDGGRLLIKKVTGIEESPLKPGDLILKLLKTTTTFFDRFPIAAQGILSNSHESPDGLISMILRLIRVDHEASS